MRKIPHGTILAISRHQARVAPLRAVVEVRWFFADGFGGRAAAATGTVAWYDAWRDAVVIPSHYESICTDALYAPTITHELTHAYQRARMGLCQYLATKVFMRSHLEDEAVREERRAETILGVSVQC